MKKLKTEYLRSKSKKELLVQFNSISKELMKLRLLQEEENNKYHVFGVMKKNISRILTILKEKYE